jgi:hypothetical protein
MKGEYDILPSWEENNVATKYEEMCEAAKSARIKKDQYRERCGKDLGDLFVGFLRYCAIPQASVTFLRWNGSDDEDGAFRLPEEPNMRYTMAGAIVLDAEGFWRIGVHVDLGVGTIFFPLLMAEQDGIAVTKVAGKNLKIDVSNQQECNEFYDQLVSRLKEAFSDPKKSKSSGFGFIVSSPEPQ